MGRRRTHWRVLKCAGFHQTVPYMGAWMRGREQATTLERREQMKTDYRDSVIYQGQADRYRLTDSRTAENRPFEIPGPTPAHYAAHLQLHQRCSSLLNFSLKGGLIHKFKNIVHWLKRVLVLHSILKSRRLPSQRLRFVFGLRFKFKKLHTLLLQYE